MALGVDRGDGWSHDGADDLIKRACYCNLCRLWGKVGKASQSQGKDDEPLRGSKSRGQRGACHCPPPRTALQPLHNIYTYLLGQELERHGCLRWWGWVVEGGGDGTTRGGRDDDDDDAAARLVGLQLAEARGSAGVRRRTFLWLCAWCVCLYECLCGERHLRNRKGKKEAERARQGGGGDERSKPHCIFAFLSL